VRVVEMPPSVGLRFLLLALTTRRLLDGGCSRYG